jgi:hypothetical protein
MSIAAALGLLLLSAEGGAAADAPAFDRPGIAFSTATIPPKFSFGIPMRPRHGRIARCIL